MVRFWPSWDWALPPTLPWNLAQQVGSRQSSPTAVRYSDPLGSALDAALAFRQPVMDLVIDIAVAEQVEVVQSIAKSLARGRNR